ncbi:hypothetical protein SARC_03266 [Sphaeroforma arctica JP610]|uniref:Uncharacterized protein n=1 Tax=Sphaeroforma arctica JP610 TaxID=667725 RepID=A0A0L0G663_9EUKA|nr:hypothetical protein SARC_03266 [Sphaeroforma arctica JP610]KNC84520.1 hypothetical protein SARC_03266 [Sphaeroforma arctica JP610]|eukprot:XP_014158422.1 hypothetical protein SARC_03266 [Sphaeroforma arctica JP610]
MLQHYMLHTFREVRALFSYLDDLTIVAKLIHDQTYIVSIDQHWPDLYHQTLDIMVDRNIQLQPKKSQIARLTKKVTHLFGRDILNHGYMIDRDRLRDLLMAPVPKNHKE